MKAHPSIDKIPPYRKGLLFISSSGCDEVGNNQEVPDDPSTIYTVFPVIDPPPHGKARKLSYFPSYSGMSPKQRGSYLQWLYDVTAEIDIGYVFVYYYGLERHLVHGDFDASFDEIQLLRRHHDNGSFQSYSASALVHSCFLRKRLDKLQELYSSGDFDFFGNSNLLFLHVKNLEIPPNMMYQLATRLSGVNRRYVKLKPELYKQKITEVLQNKFGSAGYPLTSQFSLDDVEGIPYAIFANISLIPEVRTPRLPNILKHIEFKNEMNAIFREVHETVKRDLKRRRKTSK